jgi:plastocyanin
VRRLLTAAVVLAVSAVAVPAEATTDVAIVNFSFNPATLTRTRGASVTWQNQAALTNHTATSNAIGFFDSGTLAPGARYSHAFPAAGVFAYHCKIHGSMHGKIRIPLGASPKSTTAGSHVTLTAADASVPAGATFDYQRKYNDGIWKTIGTGVSTRQIVVTVGKAGTFRFRSRVHQGSALSGFSPVAVIQVAA